MHYILLYVVHCRFKERRFLMKVADGFWLSKKGYNVNYASQAYKVETTENSI